ncbi:hypothetical protein CsSME_00051143 [Camellia sinensis var. sinensis]
MYGLKSKNSYTYYLKPRSTKYKLIGDIPDSNKGVGDDYLIVSGNWEFAPDDDLHLYSLCRGVFREDEALPQLPKSFRQSYVTGRDLVCLLDLSINKWKALILLNYMPTYRFPLPDVLRRNQTTPSTSTLQATSSPRLDQASTSDPADQPSTSAP